MDVAAWLLNSGLDRTSPLVPRENEIDAKVLPTATAEDLTSLGVTAVGHRRKLLDAIAALRQGTVRQQPARRHGRPEPPAAAADPVLPEGERRQVAVLFADLAGYTALARELDAEELHAICSTASSRSPTG